MANTRNLKLDWHTLHETLPNQSLFHQHVVEILRASSLFARMRIYQEVPVNSLVPSYPFINHRYDLFIETLDTVIELHGKQHYVATAFGKMSYEEKMREFRDIQSRDYTKKIAAIESGFLYKEIPWNVKLDLETITQIILKD